MLNQLKKLKGSLVEGRLFVGYPPFLIERLKEEKIA